MKSITFAGAPIPIPDLVVHVDPFDFDVLPDRFRPWIEDIADRIQCPPDFPAVAAMVSLAAVVGRRVGIRPMQRNDWLVVPNLWGAVVGRPGIMKTSALLEPLRPLQRLEIEAKQVYLHALKDFTAKAMVREQQRKLTQAAIKEALADNSAGAESIARDALKSEPDAPTRTRYIVNDATVEMLGVVLNQNPLGHILNYRDELAGWLVGLSKTGQEQARQFYLEAWNGTGRFTYDRIGRGTVDIDAAIVSILGGIQPEPLQRYLTGSKRDAADDGLIQRFQLLVWPDVSRDWRLVDEWPNRETRDAAHQVYFDLAKLEPAGIHATVEANEIPYLRFTPTGQEVFNDWRERLERLVRSGEEHPAMESHLAKYRSLVPTLALLDHLAGRRIGPVGHPSVERAIRWAKYLETHARRVYGATVNDRFAPARELAKRIQSGQVKSPFAPRDIYRNGWSGLPDAVSVELAADILVDHQWLAMERRMTAGRTATIYHINPSLTH